MDTSNSFSVSSSRDGDICDTDSTAIPSELCRLIKLVKNDGLTTWEQVLDGLRDYIWEKRLFDPHKMKVVCKGDELEGILGVHEFTILDIKKLIQGFVFRLHSTDSPVEDISTIPLCDSTTKRKAEDNVEETNVKRERKCEHVDCLDSCLHDKSPVLIHIPPSPNTLESASDCDSLHNVETSYAKDSSDDSIYFETDSNGAHFLPSGSILTIAETFEVEYEPVNSETEGGDSAFTDSDSDSDFELDSIITFVCKTDSDQEFWADKSSDEDFGFDVEISEFDLWMCTHCKSKNLPLNRFCLKCFQTRNGWLPEKRKTPFPERMHAKRKPRPKRKRLIKDTSELQKDSSNAHTLSLDLPSTSKENSASFEDVDFDANMIQAILKKGDTQNLKPNFDEKLCLLCCEKAIDSSIIHGKYGHSIACYRCAKRLQFTNKRCPICRRTIEKVVYQIS